MKIVEDKINNKLNLKPLVNIEKSARKVPYPLPDPWNGECYIFCCVAKIGSGKSTTISYLLKLHKRLFKKIWFCSSNVTEVNGEKIIRDAAFGNIFNFSQERLYDNFTDKTMQTILDDIKNEQESTDFDPDDRFLLIVDDLSGAFTKNNSLIFQTLMRIRHLNLCVWICTQRFRQIHPGIRAQISYFCIFTTQNSKEITAMGETMDNISDFKTLLEYATKEPYSFLFIDSSKNPAKFFKNFSTELKIID